MAGKDKMSVIKDLQNCLMFRHIQAANELWEIISNPKNQNPENILDNLKTQMDYSFKNMNKNLCLVECFEKFNNFEDREFILKQYGHGSTNEPVYPTDWIHKFTDNNMKKNLKDSSIQTDDIKNHTNEMSVQT